MKINIRDIGVLLFGIIFPVFILVQAYLGLNYLRNDVSYKTQLPDLVQNMSDVKNELNSANDYALYSLIYVEHANQKTMINKQVMKSTIIHIGFAMISIGLMLIILGFRRENDSHEFNLEAGKIKFDFKTGSTGVAMFMVGAIMASVGGILKNDYQTSQIPKFIQSDSLSGNTKYNESLAAYEACAKETQELESCFTQIFFQINQDALK